MESKDFLKRFYVVYCRDEVNGEVAVMPCPTIEDTLTGMKFLQATGYEDAHYVEFSL